MNDKGISAGIRKRIDDLPDNSAFTASDFADIADSTNARRTLKNLTDEGEIRRAMRGVYYKPAYSKLLDRQSPPDIDKVAAAIARARGWIITPSGDHALNMLGLDTQVPVVYSYISTGPYVSEQVGSFTITFKHATARNLVGMSPTTLLVIQALKALGRDGVGKRVILILANGLNDEEKRALVDESQRVTAWMRPIIKQIAEEQHD